MVSPQTTIVQAAARVAPTIEPATILVVSTATIELAIALVVVPAIVLSIQMEQHQ